MTAANFGNFPTGSLTEGASSSHQSMPVSQHGTCGGKKAIHRNCSHQCPLRQISGPRRRSQPPLRRLTARRNPRNKTAERVDLVDMKSAPSLRVLRDRTR